MVDDTMALAARVMPLVGSLELEPLAARLEPGKTDWEMLLVRDTTCPVRVRDAEAVSDAVKVVLKRHAD